MTTEHNNTANGNEYAYCPACGNIVYREANPYNYREGVSELWLLYGDVNHCDLPEGLELDNLPEINCGCNE